MHPTPHTPAQQPQWANRHTKQAPAGSAMPLVLADTNALIALSDLDRKLPLSEGRSFLGILDGMTQKGKSTLMFPRSVFNESTNWDEPLPNQERLKGYLDFTRAADGTLGLHLDTKRLNHEDNRHFVAWMKDKQAQGGIRLYGSLESCFNAREPSAAAGGVVILDTGLLGARPIYGMGVICDKIRNYANPSAPPERLIPEAESGIGKGDMEFATMSRCLSSYAQRHGISPRCLFLTDDKECKTHVLNRAATYAPDAPPIHADMVHFLAALTQKNLLTRDEYKAAINTFLHKVPPGNRPSPTRLLNAPETAAIANWLTDRSIASPPSRAL